MKTIALGCVALCTLLLSGCGASSNDLTMIKAGSGEALNPSGKPRSAEEAAMANARTQQGAKMNADMQRDAAALQAAKARTGGK